MANVCTLLGCVGLRSRTNSGVARSKCKPLSRCCARQACALRCCPGPQYDPSGVEKGSVLQPRVKAHRWFIGVTHEGNLCSRVLECGRTIRTICSFIRFPLAGIVAPAQSGLARFAMDLLDKSRHCCADPSLQEPWQRIVHQSLN